jgi:hypothetical protein
MSDPSAKSTARRVDTDVAALRPRFYADPTA